MSLHDRIMGLSVWTESKDFNKGYMDGAYDSSKLAKEADELMAEMALTLQYLADEPFNSGTAAVMLRRYNNWKESTK